MKQEQKEVIKKLIIDCVFAAKTLVNKLVELHKELEKDE